MNNLITINFSEYSQPKFVEKKNQEWVSYGEDNKYPYHLLSLLNSSAKHNAIVNGKANFITGNGIYFEDEQYQYLVDKPINRSLENINDILYKIALDIEAFGGCYLEVIFNPFGDAISLYHIDYCKVRSNPDNTCYYISDEWELKSKPTDMIIIGGFDPNNRKGKQIIYIKEYRPAVNTYTLPSYQGALNYIELDVAVSEFHLNAIHNGMMPSKLISFNNGVPSEEEQRTIERKMKEKFAGEANAGKFILNFNNDPAKAPTILDLSASNLDTQFDLLNKTIQQEIFSGHRVTSPMLFGIKTEGQLGGRNEIREAYEIFQNTYINGKQKFIERYLKYILPFFGITQPFYIKDTEPVGFEFSEQIIASVMTKDEIRDKLGLDPLVEPVIAEQNVNKQGFSEQDDNYALSVFAEFGEDASEFQVVKSRRVQFDSNFNPIEHQEFADIDILITKTQSGILDLIKKDPLISLENIAKALNIDNQVVNSSLASLEAKGFLKSSEIVKNDAVVISRELTNEGKAQRGVVKPLANISIKYKYEVNPALGAPVIDTTRPFCKGLIEMNKVYSRAEIEQVSQRLGYSVWQRRGGFYYNPKTEVTTPYCRHRWVEQVLIK
jgi:DNA-binding MarR family transcriptional regulator